MYDNEYVSYKVSNMTFRALDICIDDTFVN